MSNVRPDEVTAVPTAEELKQPAPYEIGYGKPPSQTQFTAGISGNPKGRPKGSITLKHALDRTLREKVVVKENGQRKTMTKLEAAVKQLTNKAASGDLSATKLFVSLIQSAEDQRDLNSSDKWHTDATDDVVFANILKQLKKTSEGGQYET